MPHYLVALTPPRRILLGNDAEGPIYQDCAGCGEPEAVIYGAIADEQMMVCVLRRDGSPRFENAYYCQSCFDRLVRQQRRGTLCSRTL